MPSNHNYYNLQEQRRYPLDDKSTGTDDRGARLNDATLVDCRIRWPRTLGEYAFVGGLTVTDKLVSVVILAASSPTAVSGFAPLAAVTVPQPVILGRPYPLRPMADGVGGCVVFGGGTRENQIIRFGTPAQGLLAPKCARSYAALPIPSLTKSGRNTALTGLVTIRGGNDVEVVKETVTIGDIDHEALVVRLKQDPGAVNVLERYIGPCGSRPESGNCGRPPIEYLHGVAPDCDGNVTVVVRDATVGKFEDCGGLVLAVRGGLNEVCDQVNRGIREYVDLCGSEQSSSPSSVPSSGGSDTDSSISLSSEASYCVELPLLTSFDDEDLAAWSIVEGDFAFSEVDSPDESGGESVESLDDSSESAGDVAIGDPIFASLTSIAGYTKNVALVSVCDMVSSLNKACEVGIRVTADRPKRNGGIIVNYHVVDPLSNPHVEFFYVCLDLNVNKLRVLRFNGYNFAQEYASPTLLQLMPDAWYKLRVTTQTFGNQVALGITVKGITDPAGLDITASLATSRYGDDDGQFGVCSDRGKADFSYFKLNEL